MSPTIDLLEEATTSQMEIIAVEIERLSKAFQAIKECRLTRRAVVVLIKDMTTGLRIGDIETMLDAIPDLANYFLKDEEKTT